MLLFKLTLFGCYIRTTKRRELIFGSISWRSHGVFIWVGFWACGPNITRENSEKLFAVARYMQSSVCTYFNVHFSLILAKPYFDILLPCSHSTILICFRALPIGLTSLFPEASCMWKAGNSVKDGGTNSVALGWMYIDWCLRITAWRPPLPPTLAGSRWLTASDMVRIPFEMFADEERKKNIKNFGRYWSSAKNASRRNSSCGRS